MIFLMLAISAFGGMIEVITVNDVYKAFGNEKEHAKELSVIIGVFYIVAMSVNIHFNITEEFLIFWIYALFASISYKISNIKIVLITFLTFVMFAILEVLAAVVLSVINLTTIENILSTSSTYIEAVLISKMLAYFISRFIKHLSNAQEKLTLKHGVIFSLMPVSTVIILFILSFVVYTTTSNIIKSLVIIVTIILIIANILILMLSDYVLKEIKNRIEAEKKALVYSQMVINYNQLVSMKRENAKFAHDIKHKLFAVNELIKEGSEEGVKIIEEICGMLADNEIKSYTDKKSIDSLLNVKKREMCDCGVEPEIRVFLSQAIIVSEIDLCVILGNLLDNAIEHIRGTDNKCIKVTITDKGCYIIINIKNTADDSPIIYGATSKIDKANHGFGLMNVKEIVELYDGEIKYGYNDGMYSVNIIMKNILI